ncbi:MAG TPA: copper resistance protein CopC [Chloroflexota bacterium]|nr:copper resistance protein CopC [Chloroflexota bacterium]
MHRSRLPLTALGALAALVWLLATPGAAAAHAQYERSDPPANAIVEQAPKQLRVWFTEDPEPRFSELVVYDQTGRQLPTGALQPVPGEPRALAIDLPELAPGTYTVVWKSLSAVDGHTARGAFPFTVGLDQIPAPMVIPAGTELGGAPPPTPWGVAARWLNFLVTTLVAGAFVFLPLVLGGGLRGLKVAGPEATALANAWGAGRRAGLALAALGTVAGLLTGGFGLLAQAAAAADVPPWAAFGAPLATLIGTRYWWLWLARMALLVALGGLAWALRRPGVAARHPGWSAGAGLAGLLLLTTSLNSHAAAVPQATAVAVAADWLHLVATAAWIGGLIQLAVALPATVAALPPALGGRALAVVVRRFSLLAIGAVGTLVATGLYQTWLHIGSWDALTSTTYGQALLGKLALLMPLLALGGLNLLVLSPRIATAASRGTRTALERLTAWEARLRLSVRLEVALAVALLGVVGLLTAVEPARDALRQQGVVRTVTAEDVRIVLRIAPGEAGLNTFDVALFVDGRPLPDAQRVTLRFEHLQHDMGLIEQRLDPQGDGHYRALSGALSMSGPWSIQILVRRAGVEDVQAQVAYTARDPAEVQAAAAAGPLGEVPIRLILGLVVFALGVLLLVDAVRPARRGQPRATVALGCVAVTVGLVIGALAALNPTAGEPNIPNPVAATPASVARGQELYQQHCVMCHGVGGRGDGPLARTLNPPPADLRVHVSQHTEGQLWLWISNGIPGSAMPAFKDVVSDEDRWNLVNYLRDRFGATASIAR